MMKKTFKKKIALFLTMATLFAVNALPVLAEEAPKQEGEFVEVDFDLSKRETQEVEVTLPGGEKGVLGISPVENEGPVPLEYYENASGEWRIYWYTAIVNLEYRINISNHKITDAWGLNYWTIGVTTSGGGVTFASTRACGYVDYTLFGLGSTRLSVYAQMEGTTLHTYV